MYMIDLGSFPVPDDNVVSKLLESEEPGKNEAVLVLPEKGEVKVLNDVGARIWDLLDGIRSVENIAEIISDEYKVGQKHAQEDTKAFIIELMERGAVTLSDQPVRK